MGEPPGNPGGDPEGNPDDLGQGEEGEQREGEEEEGDEMADVDQPGAGNPGGLPQPQGDGDGVAAPQNQDRTVRYMDAAPGSFSPGSLESARSFMRRFRTYCNIQGIEGDIRECIVRLSLFLRDSAQFWLDDKNFLNLADLEAQFIEDFGELHSRQALLNALDKKRLLPGTQLASCLAPNWRHT